MQQHHGNRTMTVRWVNIFTDFLRLRRQVLLGPLSYPAFCYRCHHYRQHKQKREGVHFWPMNVLDNTTIAQPTFHLNAFSIYILSRGFDVWTIRCSLWTTILEVVYNINTCAIALRTMSEHLYGTSNQGIILTE